MLESLKSISWTTIGYVSFSILLIILGWYLYSTYSKSLFNANNEHRQNPQGNKAEIVMYFADWCPNCKNAKPEWNAVKAKYDGKEVNGYTIIFVEYDCTDGSEETNRFLDKNEVEGFPTIRILKNGDVIEYQAKPTRETLEEFIKTATSS